MEPNPHAPNYEQPAPPMQMAPPYASPPPRRRFGVLGALFLLFLFGVLAVSMLMNVAFLFGAGSMDAARRVRERYVSHERFAPHKVAIISLDGVILDADDGFVKRQIDQAAKDDALKAVVLRINSPGGTITGSDYLYHHLTKLREESSIPIVVSMGSLAASGGYYVAMAVGDNPDVIFAEPTTWTGSIGVIIPHYNASKLIEHIGVEENSIASHRLKGMGSFFKTMTDEEREIFQALVDDGFARFKQVIKTGRPKFEKDGEALDKLATGQVYSANQALELGLVDKIGFVEEAIERAIELADVDPKEVTVVKYEREPSLASLLLGVQAQRSSFDLAALFDLAAPRAYYLYTMVPPLIRGNH